MSIVNDDKEGEDGDDDNYPMVIKELAQLPNIASFGGKMIINLQVLPKSGSTFSRSPLDKVAVAR